MESKGSAEVFKDESPSQEDISLGRSMKLDAESVDDFEHIIKDVSPSKEATEKFLDYETKYASSRNKENSPYDDIVFDYSVVAEEQDSRGLHSKNPESWGWAEEPSASLMDTDYSSSQLVTPADSSEDVEGNRSGDDKVSSSKNFMQYENVDSGDDGDVSPMTPSPSRSVTDDQLVDVESSTIAFNDSTVKSGDLKLTNNSEILMQDSLADSKPAPATIASQSLPGIVKAENEPDVHSELVPQGDGLHWKQTGGLDASDSEEQIPEPLPKDYPEIGIIKPRALLAAIGLGNWFNPERLSPKVEGLIYWRDVKKSGIVFGIGLALLISMCCYSFISVVAYASLSVLISAASYRTYKNVLQAVQKTSDGHPFKGNLLKVLTHPLITEVFETIKEYLDLDMTLDQDKTRETLEGFVKYLNNTVIELRRRFLVEDIIDSLKFGICLWVLTYIGAWFNGLSLIIIAYVGLFTLPKFYENNKTQIDANLDLAKAKFDDFNEKVKAVLPFGKKEEAKAKDE